VPNSEYHISEEFRQQREEGKRRQRIHEGIDLPTLADKGGCIGTHKLAGSGKPTPASLAAAAFAAEHFDIYSHDPKGLEQELRDLMRDAERYEKHEGVKFDV
jgi:hypothetical protein